MALKDVSLSEPDRIDQLEKQEARLIKYKSHYHLMDKWMVLKEDGKSIKEYCCDKGIESVAIYGMGILGRHLYTEMKLQDISVKYVIDRVLNSYKDTKIFKPDEDLPKVDAVIVTPIDEYYEIRNEFGRERGMQLISLEEIIDYCLVNGTQTGNL